MYFLYEIFEIYFSFIFNYFVYIKILGKLNKVCSEANSNACGSNATRSRFDSWPGPLTLVIFFEVKYLKTLKKHYPIYMQLSANEYINNFTANP